MTQTFSKLVCTRVYASDYQKEGTLTAEIKQQVKTVTTYDVSGNNSLTDDLFDMSTKRTYENIETRVAWINVPSNVTQADVQKQLDSKKNARLYRVLSNYPILSSSDKWTINEGLRSMDDFADAQIVRYPSNHEHAGEVVLDPNGKHQYRRIGFSLNGKEDIDERTQEPDNQYVITTTEKVGGFVEVPF